jgi:hypothetical protein
VVHNNRWSGKAIYDRTGRHYLTPISTVPLKKTHLLEKISCWVLVKLCVIGKLSKL